MFNIYAEIHEPPKHNSAPLLSSAERGRPPGRACAPSAQGAAPTWQGWETVPDPGGHTYKIWQQIFIRF